MRASHLCVPYAVAGGQSGDFLTVVYAVQMQAAGTTSSKNPVDVHMQAVQAHTTPARAVRKRR
ncbi:hypothetical protein BDV95DRAFT_557309 [Massariosphaeria phaeospora]|uniref:Uncharacterized protein n=1 Tax=Massariosphaeria phaeospora TaxID=100035 RepID=A0A7C8IRN4_9PLEO|nr:hypothetical protein BDV95DRAFT_557309 [Massariosphaeria phaeospora]